jgi:hypothetical protein
MPLDHTTAWKYPFVGRFRVTAGFLSRDTCSLWSTLHYLNVSCALLVYYSGSEE